MKYRVHTDKDRHEILGDKLIINDAGQLIIIDSTGTRAAFATGAWRLVMVVEGQ